LGFTEVLLIPALCFYIIFGVFNYRKKALAFLGDSGSIGTGLLVSTCLIFLFNEFQSIHVLSLVLVYGVDSVGTILIRLIRRENIFKAHRSHFYQDFVHKLGISHLVVSISYAGIQLIINMLYLSNYFSRTAIFVVSLLLLIVTFVIGKKKMGTLKLNQLF
jgi:UDP-N-acetylmuramyl pentapeptide phosphotransferase/UDP-N-acetylglucosamine-1-phosphate transferase